MSASEPDHPRKLLVKLQACALKMIPKVRLDSRATALLRLPLTSDSATPLAFALDPLLHFASDIRDLLPVRGEAELSIFGQQFSKEVQPA